MSVSYTRFLKALVIAGLFLPCAAQTRAETITYYEDPVYQKINPQDSHPMGDLLALAEQGDARAQYILGDLYGKGKGGLGKNRVKARYWFETAALNGYTMAFIRLAALAKAKKDWVSAYKWYTLGIETGDGGERRWSARARDRLEKEQKLSRADLREAKEAVNAWRTKREKELAERREKERAAREAAQQKDKAEGKQAAAAKQAGRTGKKESHYNE